jgi:Coenzyme PQQ synthesis protein D (PqqD)
MKKFPKARRERLIIEELPDEILIYDEERHEAHCLNQTAALVWKECDGQQSVGEISARLSAKVKAPVSEPVVWYALQEFEKHHLLAEEMTAPPELLAGMNRRQMVRAMGLAAAVAVPLVTSIVAPTSADAANCLASGQPCTASANCCSGICANGTCA